MMLENLVRYFECEDPPYDPFGRVESVRFEDDDGILGLSVKNFDETEEWSRWEVRAKGLVDYIIAEPFGELFLFEGVGGGGDHPLIQQYMEPQQELYFRGHPSAAMEVIGRLLVAHRESMGEWIPFERFIKTVVGLEDLLAGGYGLLADGPKFLMEHYASVLAASGIKSNTLPPRRAKRWNGQQYVNYTAPLVALIIGGSFFVAENFDEKLLSGSDGPAAQ